MLKIAQSNLFLINTSLERFLLKYYSREEKNIFSILTEKHIKSNINPFKFEYLKLAKRPLMRNLQGKNTSILVYELCARSKSTWHLFGEKLSIHVLNWEEFNDFKRKNSIRKPKIKQSD